MQIKVDRLDHVFAPDSGPAWMVSHATYATPIVIDKDTIRVFFVARDDQNHGVVCWLDVSAHDPTRVVRVCDRPALACGDLGTFDDSGIAIGCINAADGKLWLYYMGWNPARNVPFRNAIGLAVSTDTAGETFERVSRGPILDRSRFDHYTLSYPFVVRSVDEWKMYYGTHRGNGVREEDMQHVITCATSDNGIDWLPTGMEVIGLEKGEYGLSRPWVANLNGTDLMLYSIRRKNYTIGASCKAEDGRSWKRISSDIMSHGEAAWENEAACYPAVICVGGKNYLFYSGNGYGRTGFGVATITVADAEP